MALNRRRTQQRVSLGAAVAKLLQILDGVQAGLAVGHVGVQVVLLAALVDRDAFEDQVLLIARRHVAGLEDRVLHAVLLAAVLDDIDADVNPAGHLDGAAEGDFSIALGEVQVAHRQPAALDVDREEHA